MTSGVLDLGSSSSEHWVLALLRSELQRPVFAERMSLLFIRLLRSSETGTLIDEALDYLMTEAQIDEARFRLILEFVRALGPSQNFDSLFWIKRILAEGNEPAKARALRMLAGGLEHTAGWLGERGQDLLGSIRCWLPDKLKSIEGFNNQAAVLLTPRLSFHIASSRIKQREFGTLDRLVPFFDLQYLTGVSPFAGAALEILTLKVTGDWILFELGTLETMVAARWGISALEPDPDESGAPEVDAISFYFPHLGFLEKALHSESWDDGVAQRLSLALILIEGVAVFIDNFGPGDSVQKTAVRNLLDEITSRYKLRDDAKEAYALYQQVYRIYSALMRCTDRSDRRRGAAKYVGDHLYRSYRAHWARGR